MALQRWRATMQYYVGLDVSLRQTSICVVDQTGPVVREGVVLRRSQFTCGQRRRARYVSASRPDRRPRGLTAGPRSFLSRQAQVGGGHGPRRDIRRGEGPSSRGHRLEGSRDRSHPGEPPCGLISVQATAVARPSDYLWGWSMFVEIPLTRPLRCA